MHYPVLLVVLQVEQAVEPRVEQVEGLAVEQAVEPLVEQVEGLAVGPEVEGQTVNEAEAVDQIVILVRI